MTLVPPDVVSNPLTQIFIKEVARRGIDWLADLVKSHRGEMVKQSETNAQDFLNLLAERVDRLEAALTQSEKHAF